MSYLLLQRVETALLTVAGCAIALLVLHRYLARSRPGFDIRGAIAAAAGARMAAVALVGLLASARELRGGDELLFVSLAGEAADASWGSALLSDPFALELHVRVMAAQLALFESDAGLRITHIAIATAGILFFAAAAYDLAGARAARLAAWLLALEPAGVFFHGVLHKESLLVLAVGLVALGGTQIWLGRRSLPGAASMAAGCLLALATRPYVGWFLVASSLVLMLHAGLRGIGSAAPRSALLVGVVGAAAIILVPITLQEAEPHRLPAELQRFHDATVAERANLNLEPVDVSSVPAILSSLPRRSIDLVARPYPWQLDNTSQRLGALGGLVALGILALLVRVAVTARGRIWRLAPPLLYPLVVQATAYSLTAGNAGTAFRHRIHVVALAAVLTAVFLETARQQRGAVRPDEHAGAPAPRTRDGRTIGSRALG